jgi:hypothetical protein
MIAAMLSLLQWLQKSVCPPIEDGGYAAIT